MRVRSIFPSIIFTLIVFHSFSFAQTLIEKRFTAASESEAFLGLSASAPGAAWIERGAEAATVKVFVDDNYQQDIVLFAGARNFNYRVSLGRVAAGEHKLRIELNRRLTAEKISTVKIDETAVSVIGRDKPEFQAIAHTPILYARPNTIGRFSDIPLLMYYETIREGKLTTYRYTVIFSNEDGGTQTSALMARWGRTTDIEWVSETQIDADGRVLKSIYQGINHETKTFAGAREADHPLLITASDNNNFADNSKSDMRFALLPVAVDLSSASRETVMDSYPWIYQIMSEEMIREGKITTERTLGPRIADLRSYLYLDAAAEQKNGAVLSFAVKLKGDSKWYTSDMGIGSYKIDRSGYFRTTVRLPAGTNAEKIERIAARCDLNGNPRSAEEINKASAAQCELNKVNRVFFLNNQFRPANEYLIKSNPVTLPFGEMVVLQGDCSLQ